MNAPKSSDIGFLRGIVNMLRCGISDLDSPRVSAASVPHQPHTQSSFPGSCDTLAHTQQEFNMNMPGTYSPSGNVSASCEYQIREILRGMMVLGEARRLSGNHALEGRRLVSTRKII